MTPRSRAQARGDRLIAELECEFVVESAPVRVGGHVIDIRRPRSPEDLISEADFERDERLPYWAELWPSARILAERLVRTPGDGIRLIELGCGVGLVTIVAMMAGYHVLATDYYADALRFTRANAWAALKQQPTTKLLDWRRLPRSLGPAKMVVAADVLYERAYGPIVARAVRRLLAPGGKAIVADPGRVGADAFLSECRTLGLKLTSSERVAFVAGDIRQTITLYTLTAS